jgi:hypothetical protein
VAVRPWSSLAAFAGFSPGATGLIFNGRDHGEDKRTYHEKLPAHDGSHSSGAGAGDELDDPSPVSLPATATIARFDVG